MDSQIAKKTDNFFARYPLQEFDKGQIFIYAGDSLANVYQIVSGRARKYDITAQGEEVTINIFQPPIYFPMVWAVTKTPNRYFYEAITPISVRVAPVNDVVQFLKSNADITYDLLGQMYLHYDELQLRLAHILGGDSYSRVSFELIIACKKFGELQKDGSYIVDMHENDLARQAGLSRETVNRELVKLKKANLIKINHRHLVVTKLLRLEAKLGDDL